MSPTPIPKTFPVATSFDFLGISTSVPARAAPRKVWLSLVCNHNHLRR